MPKPRKQLISLDATPYYHCVSRCVRRAYLCGFDTLTNKSYEHRRQWIEDRIHFLASTFAIDVCAFAVMSNHTHLVLHVNKAKNAHWDDREVATRWHSLYKGTLLTQKFLHDEPLNQAEQDAVQNKINEWREQLCSISWFMRALNEPIARQANAEDKCTGKFWEGRFKSQALLDDKALIACMAYVDLNPVRAKMAEVPENSEYTSIKQRCDALKSNKIQPETLAPFIGNPRNDMPPGLPFHLKDYIGLVEWTGRIIRDDKRGHIKHNLPPILDRLDIDPHKWLILSTQFEAKFKTFVGTKHTLRKAAQALGLQRSPGLTNCCALFG